LPRGDHGFDLLIIPESLPEPSEEPVVDAGKVVENGWSRAIGRDLAPALRQPITRIIANAETIRTRLAGPLAEDYTGYAADIADAGRHLLDLVEDLADLDAVESPGFAPAPDRIDLGDCARRAAGILGVRAQERSIRLITPPEGMVVPAIGEFRRVLQILLNLITNAIRYGPANSTVTITVLREENAAWVSVADEGDG
jgi:signal transduction histidine kinase